MRTKKIDPEIAIAVQCQYALYSRNEQKKWMRAVLVELHPKYPRREALAKGLGSPLVNQKPCVVLKVTGKNS